MELNNIKTLNQMKKTTFKRAIFAIALLLITATSSWAYSFCVDGIYYVKNSDGVSVSVTYADDDYNSYSGSVVIPSTVAFDGTTYSVTKIGENAFKKCQTLTSVTIPESVTEIGVYSFTRCENLTSVTIPESVTLIDYGAFENCRALTSVTIPSSVTTIGKDAFEDCWNLTKVEISDLTAWCNISFATIPSNPLYHAKHLFINGTELTELVIPESITEIGQNAFCFCHGLTSVTIHDAITKIGNNAFQNCIQMTTLAIGNSVYSIGDAVFYNCENLTSATIPNSVSSIGSDAFANCIQMTTLTIGNSVSSIGQYAFSDCYNLTSADIPDLVTEIYDGTFNNCHNLSSLTIGNSVTSIGQYAFYNCRKLTSVTIPQSVTKIGESAFYGCYDVVSFISENTTPPVLPSEKVFKGIPRQGCTLYVPEESISTYRYSTGWTHFLNIKGIEISRVGTIENNEIEVIATDGAISISGADGAIAEIYSPGGTLLYIGSDSTIKMPRGIYIVKVAGTTTKVVL